MSNEVFRMPQCLKFGEVLHLHAINVNISVIRLDEIIFSFWFSFVVVLGLHILKFSLWDVQLHGFSQMHRFWYLSI